MNQTIKQHNISVIIPHYNNGNEIVRAYESVMTQTLLPQEIIIVDDCSLSKEYLYSLETSHDISSGVELKIIYFEHNQGPSIARNIGVKYSTSEYIAFLDADDVWIPHKLEVVTQLIREQGALFIAHKYSFLEPTNNATTFTVKILKIKKLNLAYRTYLFTPAIVMKKDIFSGFPEHLMYSEDLVCWIMSNPNEFFYYINITLAHGFKKPVGEKGLSANIPEMHRGFIKALKYLRKRKDISLCFFWIALICEYIKYPLRFFR